MVQPDHHSFSNNHIYLNYEKMFESIHLHFFLQNDTVELERSQCMLNR